MNPTTAVNGPDYMELADELHQTREDLKDAQAYIGLTLENLASHDRRRRQHFQDLVQLKQTHRTTSFRLNRVRKLLQGIEQGELNYLEQRLRQRELMAEGQRSFRRKAARRNGRVKQLMLDQA